MKRPAILFLLSLACVSVAAKVNAHYFWISVDRVPEKMKGTNIYFEESPNPGDGHYLDHFLGKSDVWVRTIEQPSPASIEAREIKQGDRRWMRVELPESEEYSVDAYGKFGVYEYGTKKVLLHYYARNFSVESHDAMHELGRAEQMDLDLVPHQHGGQIEFTLLWKGEPVADRMVFVRGPNGFRRNVKTDSRGKVEVTLPSEGELTLRSSVEFPTLGREDGESYEAIRHNITFLMPLQSKASSDGL